MKLSIALASALALTACGTSAPSVQTTTDLIADAVKVEMPIILPALSADDQASATRYASDIEAARQAIDAAVASGQPVNAQTLVAALQSLAPIVSAHVPANSPAAIAIASAVALAPLVLAESGMAGAKQGSVVDQTKNRMVLVGATRR